MRLFLAEPVGPFHTAAGAAFNTFTTKQDISPSPIPVVPGGRLEPGMKLWIQSHGEFSTTGTPTLQLGYYIGTRAASITTDIALSSAITTGSAAAAWPWALEWFGIVTAVGTSGSVTGAGELKLGTALTTWSTFPLPITAAARTFTWDTTIERAVGVSGAWSASSASNSIKVNSHQVMIIN
jgi:hypothetical protein